jgi:hypothetical protein
MSLRRGFWCLRYRTAGTRDRPEAYPYHCFRSIEAFGQSILRDTLTNLNVGLIDSSFPWIREITAICDGRTGLQIALDTSYYPQTGDPMLQGWIKAKKISENPMKPLSLLLLGAMAGTLALSTGCAATGTRNSSVSMLMPGTAVPPRVTSDGDQDFYQPPRNPQFNTARDQ